MLRRRVATLCAALSLLVSSAADPETVSDRPYQVNDLLALEELGQVMFDPHGALLIVERLARYDHAASFANGPWGRRANSKVLAMPADGHAPMAPLFKQEENAGYWIGSFSPNGLRASVFRLTRDRLDLGVLDLHHRSVRWLPLVPDAPLLQHAPSWIDDDHLAVIAMPTRRLPLMFSLSAAQDDSVALWRAQANGRTASSIVVSSTEPVPRPNQLRDVFVVDVPSGTMQRRFHGAVLDIAATPRQLAILSIAGPVRAPRDEPMTFSFNGNRLSLDVVHVRGKEDRPVRVADDVMPGLLAWNARGTRLLYAVKGGLSAWMHPRLVVTTLQDGRGTRTTLPVEPRALPDMGAATLHARWWGDKILFEADTGVDRAQWQLIDVRATDPVAIGPPKAALVQLTARTATFRVDGNLWRLPVQAGQPELIERNVVAGLKAPLATTYVGARGLMNPEERVAAFRSASEGAAYAFVLQEDGTPSDLVTIPAGSELLTASPGHAVVEQADDHGVQTISLARRDQPLEPIATLNRHLATVATAKVRKVSSALSDGERHNHWLFLPPGPARAPPPLVVSIYPGALHDNELALGSMRNIPVFVQNISVLVGHGYAVLVPSLPYARKSRDPFRALADDVEAAVDAAVANAGLDRGNVAVLGHSFGGYGVLALATRTGRYRAFVSQNAPYDLAAAYGALNGPDRTRLDYGLPFPMGTAWAETGQAAMGVPPWRAPNAYVAASPAYALDKISTPLLLIGGDQDFVSMESAERTFLSLTRLGQDVTLVRYWGEGHDLVSPANVRDYYARMFRFLDSRFQYQSLNGR